MKLDSPGNFMKAFIVFWTLCVVVQALLKVAFDLTVPWILVLFMPLLLIVIGVLLLVCLFIGTDFYADKKLEKKD